jgi:adenosylmethionine-8-amino-7-oxononanoate aminotransferase
LLLMIELKPNSTQEHIKEIAFTEKYWVHYLNAPPHLEIQSGNAAFGLGYQAEDLRDIFSKNKIDFIRGNSGETSEAVEKLNETLCSTANMESIAYAVSGSDANEAAIYMHDTYWVNIGRPKTHLVSFYPCYHGTTYLNRQFKNDMLPSKELSRVKMIRGKEWYTDAERIEHETMLTDSFITTLQANPTIGGCIMESMPWNETIAPYSQEFWKTVRQICDEFNILMIVDDVAGYGGKVGTLFTHTYYGVTPDIVTIGKALTNGMVPLSAALANEKVTKGVRKKNWDWGHTWQPNMYGVELANRVIEILNSKGYLTIDHQNYIGKKIKELETFLVNEKLATSIIGKGCWRSIQTNPIATPIGLYHLSNAGMAATTSHKMIKLILPLIVDDEYFDELKARTTLCLTTRKEEIENL